MTVVTNQSWEDTGSCRHGGGFDRATSGSGRLTVMGLRGTVESQQRWTQTEAAHRCRVTEKLCEFPVVLGWKQLLQGSVGWAEQRQQELERKDMKGHREREHLMQRVPAPCGSETLQSKDGVNQSPLSPGPVAILGQGDPSLPRCA